MSVGLGVCAQMRKMNKSYNHKRLLDTLESQFFYAGFKAVSRKKSWELTKSQYIELLYEANCNYCNEKLWNCGRRVNLDRIDNTKSYIIGNVTPCCGMCNMMKQRYTQEEFFEQICKIYKNKARLRR